MVSLINFELDPSIKKDPARLSTVILPSENILVVSRNNSLFSPFTLIFSFFILNLRVSPLPLILYVFDLKLTPVDAINSLISYKSFSKYILTRSPFSSNSSEIISTFFFNR